jgi:hypothetical protein
MLIQVEHRRLIARWLLRGTGCALLFATLAPRTPRSLPAEAWAANEGLLSARTETRGEDEPIVVGWRTLAGLNFRTGQKTPALEQLQGKLVRIPGFMVPLEDEADGVTEFLLVPYFGACIHTPPPPPNQIVYVRMKKKVKADMYTPIWVDGPLKIENADSYYGTVGFQLDGVGIKPYEMK